MRQAGLEGRQKTSVSDVVTAADHAAESYVLEQLRRCRPDDAVLGEEGASVAGSSGRTWVIDPVDGTYNFLHGSTYWCSAIALKDSSGAGARRHLPARGGQTLARRDSPGRRLSTAKSWSLSCPGRPGTGRSDTPVSELGAATYIHPTWLADPMCAMPWHAAATSAAALRMFGSGSCDLGRVADGRARLLVPAQLPRVGLAAREGNRGGGRRRDRRRARQRTRLVHRGRHDGGAAAARALSSGGRLGVPPAGPPGHAHSSRQAGHMLMSTGPAAGTCDHVPCCHWVAGGHAHSWRGSWA